MEVNDIEKGMQVKINQLDDTKGMSINKKHLDVRKADIEGVILDAVPGHGGDVWWIEHNNKEVGAYCFTEFDKII